MLRSSLALLALVVTSSWSPSSVLFAQGGLGRFNSFIVDDSTSHGQRWSPEQIAGPPNTAAAGDIATAWASLTRDEQDEWILCEFEKPVAAAQVSVYETYNPGAISKVTVFGAEEQEVVIFEGTDPVPTSASRGIANFAVNVDFEITKVKIDLASRTVEGWNEIDAVGLVMWNGETLWTSSATASSTYASHYAPAPTNGVHELKLEINALRAMLEQLEARLQLLDVTSR